MPFEEMAKQCLSAENDLSALNDDCKRKKDLLD